MLQSKDYTRVKNTLCVCEKNSWPSIEIIGTWSTASAYWGRYSYRPLTIHRTGIRKVSKSVGKCLPCIPTWWHEGQYHSWWFIIVNMTAASAQIHLTKDNPFSISMIHGYWAMTYLVCISTILNLSSQWYIHDFLRPSMSKSNHNCISWTGSQKSRW